MKARPAAADGWGAFARGLRHHTHELVKHERPSAFQLCSTQFFQICRWQEPALIPWEWQREALN